MGLAIWIQGGEMREYCEYIMEKKLLMGTLF